MSAEQYLAFEERSELRHEFVAGSVHAMAGGSGRHNRIAGNTFAQFWNLAQDKPCRVYQEGMKLRAAESVFYYPDVMVVCNKEEPDPYFETEPCILVEVLSPSTKDIDLREKLLSYKSLPSVQAYLAIDAERVAVQHFWCDELGTWQQQTHSGEGEIKLPCLNNTISLAQIYRSVF